MEMESLFNSRMLKFSFDVSRLVDVYKPESAKNEVAVYVKEGNDDIFLYLPFELATKLKEKLEEHLNANNPLPKQ